MSYSECKESSESIACQRRFVISWNHILSSSHRILTGIFIKMGQHMATLVVLPVEWTSTMKVLQDRCEPTPYSALEDMFLADMGAPVTELFDDFDPTPIGVASLAQVHVGHHRASGQRVAVKVSFYESPMSISQEAAQLQHPHLAEFCDIDIEMVDVTLGWYSARDYLMPHCLKLHGRLDQVLVS